MGRSMKGDRNLLVFDVGLRGSGRCFPQLRRLLRGITDALSLGKGCRGHGQHPCVGASVAVKHLRCAKARLPEGLENPRKSGFVVALYGWSERFRPDTADVPCLRLVNQSIEGPYDLHV